MLDGTGFRERLGVDNVNAPTSRRKSAPAGPARALLLCIFAPSGLLLSTTAFAAPRAHAVAQPMVAVKRTVMQCAAGRQTATVAKYRDRSGQALKGFIFGTGHRGLVFANQSDSRACDWLPLARAMAKRAFRVLLFDYAVQPQAPQEIVAGVAVLRHLGVRQFSLVGASMGGTASLVASNQVTSGGVPTVSISGPAEFMGLNARKAVPKLHQRLLFLASTDDTPYSTDAQTLFASAPAKNKRLKLYPGSRHGIEILLGPQGKDATKLVTQLLTSG